METYIKALYEMKSTIVQMGKTKLAIVLPLAPIQILSEILGMRKLRFAAGLVLIAAVSYAFQASHYETPAGFRAPIRWSGGAVLPGGRLIAPLGRQLKTGPGPFGLALSAMGKVATANLGPERLSMTVLQRDKSGAWLVHNFLNARPLKDDEKDAKDGDDWRATFMGVAFASEKQIWVSEGNTGRVRLIEAETGDRVRSVNLNAGDVRDSFAGDLAFDRARNIVYIADQANFRVLAIDAKKGRILSSVAVGRLPFALAMAPDGNKIYVTNVGVFQYSAVPGGVPFPAFGFPSEESRKVLGDPNVRESNSVCVVDVSEPAAMKVAGFIRTGRPFSTETSGGSSPSGVLATAGSIYVANAHDDSITIIDSASGQVQAEIQLTIPGLEKLRGIMPLGMAVDPAANWLLVAEAGINAVGVIDLKTRNVIGHIPAGWFPTRVAVQDGTVYVTNAKGEGTGPNLPDREYYQDGSGLVGTLHRGTVSIFPLPSAGELKKHTETVLSANGFAPVAGVPAAIPAALKYVVLIVKENRTFDEVFGDVNGAAGIRQLARFGMNGYADGGGTRLSLNKIGVTPNHHAMAQRWTIADNFYADSEVSVDGHHWLVGNYPDAWTETSLMSAYAGQKNFRLGPAPGRLSFADSNSSVHPEEIDEGGTIWHHLERNHIPFRNYGEGFELAGNEEKPGEKPTGARLPTNIPMPDPLYRNTSRVYPGFNMNIPDQYRAGQLIGELNEKYFKTGEPLPRFIYIHLPNDHIAKTRPEDGYPYPASYVADNDFALGRIVEYLSHSPWWKEMAVFVTEDDAQGGRDHIDSHRTVLMVLGPYCKPKYVLHRNTSFPGLLKTVFRILDIAPLNLYDAAATDLSDAFTATPDFSSYAVQPADPRLFVPANAREPLDPKAPRTPMDGPPLP